MTSLNSIAAGACILTENLFETRFRHVPELLRMGADITVKVEVADDIAPPLNKGEKVGVLRIYCGGEQVGCVDAEAGSDMAAAEPEYRIKPCFFTTLKRMIKSIFG